MSRIRLFSGKFANDLPLYKVWLGMKTRCYNPKAVNYRWYGLRGITVCDAWVKDFEAFYIWAKSNGYRRGLTIDRKNGAQSYSPENCQWVTMKTQNKNRRAHPRTVLYSINGKSLSINRQTAIDEGDEPKDPTFKEVPIN